MLTIELNEKQSLELVTKGETRWNTYKIIDTNFEIKKLTVSEQQPFEPNEFYSIKHWINTTKNRDRKTGLSCLVVVIKSDDLRTLSNGLWSKQELLKYRGIGAKAIKLINKILQEKGLPDVK